MRPDELHDCFKTKIGNDHSILKINLLDDKFSLWAGIGMHTALQTFALKINCPSGTANGFNDSTQPAKCSMFSNYTAHYFYFVCSLLPER